MAIPFHTLSSKQLFETESADIKFCNLITYTFSASKVISHSEVDQNITNVSDLRNYCPLWPVLRLGRTKNITKTKRFPPNYVGPVKTWLKSNGYEIIGFFFLRPVLRPGQTKNVTKTKRFSLTTSAQRKIWLKYNSSYLSMTVTFQRVCVPTKTQGLVYRRESFRDEPIRLSATRQWESSKSIGRYTWTNKRQREQRPMGRLFKHSLAAV